MTIDMDLPVIGTLRELLFKLTQCYTKLFRALVLSGGLILLPASSQAYPSELDHHLGNFEDSIHITRYDGR